jgi:flagellar basal-body rod modification protein FlgD
MTTTPPVTGQVIDYVAQATAPKAPVKKDLDKDAFLKLMVAQLKYQDPSNPSSSAEFLAQTAQFTVVEKLSALADSQASMLSAQLMLGASNLVGRTVSYPDEDGVSVTGVVTSASFSGSSPTLRVGDKDVALSSVKEVRNTISG